MKFTKKEQTLLQSNPKLLNKINKLNTESEEIWKVLDSLVDTDIWEDLCCEFLTESFCERYKKDIPWNNVIWSSKVPELIISKYIDYLHFPLLLNHQTLSENFLREYAEEFDEECWRAVSSRQDLTRRFLSDYSEKIDWMVLLDNRCLREDVIKEFMGKIVAKVSKKNFKIICEEKGYSKELFQEYVCFKP